MHGEDNVGAHDPDPSAHATVQMTLLLDLLLTFPLS